MTQLLASIEDVNTFLPPNVQVQDSSAQLQVDAQRLIRAQLAAVYPPTTLALWVNPDSTPELIRAIAGRLIAARYYAELISQESGDEVPGYALSLYTEAIMMLASIKDGSLIVVDVNGDPIIGNSTDLDPSLDVFPNDGIPVFTMVREFGHQGL
jgi:hypothetical protein